MAIGQRIQIDGIIRSKQFFLDDGRPRQRLIIKSNNVRLQKTDRNTDHRDVNNVKMIARICSEIRHTLYYSQFILEANHVVKYATATFPVLNCIKCWLSIDWNVLVGFNRRDGGKVITEFHRVLVYDQLARSYAKTLNQFDRIFVDGKVSYSSYQDSSGKTLLGGYIVAQIIKQMEWLL